MTYLSSIISTVPGIVNDITETETVRDAIAGYIKVEKKYADRRR